MKMESNELLDRSLIEKYKIMFQMYANTRHVKCPELMSCKWRKMYAIQDFIDDAPGTYQAICDQNEALLQELLKQKQLTAGKNGNGKAASKSNKNSPVSNAVVSIGSGSKSAGNDTKALKNVIEIYSDDDEDDEDALVLRNRKKIRQIVDDEDYATSDGVQSPVQRSRKKKSIGKSSLEGSASGSGSKKKSGQRHKSNTSSGSKHKDLLVLDANQNIVFQMPTNDQSAAQPINWINPRVFDGDDDPLAVSFKRESPMLPPSSAIPSQRQEPDDAMVDILSFLQNDIEV